MKSLGADKTVDYKDEKWTEEVKTWSNGGVTKALAIQPNTEFDSIKAVQDGETLITVSGYGSTIQSEREINVRQMGHELFTTKELSKLADDIAEGKIQLVIEKEYSFENALEALEKTENTTCERENGC
ncbi:MAG TPA: zinc-binding dehydrogenase [Brumimicrobium sp.]|nr:zinc-binding dehydrogenase [Brumimicrobium sp.]